MQTKCLAYFVAFSCIFLKMPLSSKCDDYERRRMLTPTTHTNRQKTYALFRLLVLPFLSLSSPILCPPKQGIYYENAISTSKLGLHESKQQNATSEQRTESQRSETSKQRARRRASEKEREKRQLKRHSFRSVYTTAKLSSFEGY